MPRVLALLIVLFALHDAPAGAAERSVPQGWLGVTADGPMTPFEPGEWNRMASSGVESVRAGVRWYEVQPYPPGSVPPEERSRFRDMNGVPTDLSRFDAVVAAASARGMAVLPVVHLVPAWAAERPDDATSPPADPATFGRFMATLVGRYGPNGSFWGERPDLPRMPIRAWQVWNEPNIKLYWTDQPFAPSFVPVLRAAAQSVRAADPGATIVLAGLTNRSWEALRAIYEAGGRGFFDAVALHPYTRRPRDVLRIIRLARREMRSRGDGALPIWVTELSWPAPEGKAKDRVQFEVSAAGQARRLGAAVRMLALARQRLRIERVFWYTWLSSEKGPSAFDWSGLRRVRHGRAVWTPALRRFRRVARLLEGCRKARADALRCA
jgi:hypothetical protein